MSEKLHATQEHQSVYPADLPHTAPTLNLTNQKSIQTTVPTEREATTQTVRWKILSWLGTAGWKSGES